MPIACCNKLIRRSEELYNGRSAPKPRRTRSAAQSHDILADNQLRQKGRAQQSSRGRDQSSRRNMMRTSRGPSAVRGLRSVLDQRCSRVHRTRTFIPRPHAHHSAWRNMRVVDPRMTHHVPPMDHPHEAQQVQPEKNPAEQKTTRNGFCESSSATVQDLLWNWLQSQFKSTQYVVPGYTVLHARHIPY